MNRKTWVLTIAGCIGLLASVIWLVTGGASFSIVDPKGTIAQQQRDLLVFASVLSLLVVVPVFVMLGIFTYKYREGRQARYEPDNDHNTKLETLWWGIPIIIIGILAVVTWQTSHSLDPYKSITSTQKPLRVQVIALDWKWLFLYPEQGIATVNYVQLPKDRPVSFAITADAPMNSFWIPQLGGQIYAMAGMQTQLHLQASQIGIYEGSSANLSGEGFADMRFKAEVVEPSMFDEWATGVKYNPNTLDSTLYAQLAQPSVQKQPSYYALRQTNLYDTVLHEYMSHGDDHGSGH